MKEGNYYVYYKPTYINGFEQYLDKDIDFSYLQAYEGVCRDEFILNDEFVLSQTFKDALSKFKGFHTENFAIQIFD